MTVPCQVTEVFVRGGTVQWFTNFYDAYDEITQPTAGKLIVKYPQPGGTNLISIDMTPPAGSETRWTAQWDSRGSNTGIIYWSIYSTPGPPFGVEDGVLELDANPANLGAGIA